MSKIVETDLIEKKEIRDEMLSRIEVLDKVKKLILLPNSEIMTTKMVSEWFEVEFKTLQKVTERHSKELKENGMSFKTYGEIRDILKTYDMSAFKISKRGSYVFSKRAILNIGMLLTDSIIAKEVRSALLDHQEVLTDEQKTVHIDEEKELALKIMFAANEGEMMIAFNKYNEYKNRHIKQLEDTIEENKPKLDVYNTFMDGSNVKPMNDVAKALNNGIGRNNLYKFLRQQGVLMRDNTPYQQFITRGYFKVKISPIKIGSYIENKSTTYVTAKGMEYIKKLVKDKYIS